MNILDKILVAPFGSLFGYPMVIIVAVLLVLIGLSFGLIRLKDEHDNTKSTMARVSLSSLGLIAAIAVVLAMGREAFIVLIIFALALLLLVIGQLFGNIFRAAGQKDLDMKSVRKVTLGALFKKENIFFKKKSNSSNDRHSPRAN